MTDTAAGAAGEHPAGMAALSLGALGVVYGDIGTNPLFAVREAFEAHHHVSLGRANVLGLLSLMFWSLLVVVTLKYLTVVMRADNDGEGGILALAALIERSPGGSRRRTWLLGLVAVFGAALLYGDGMVTPAISVLSAVEGSEVATPSLKPFVIPIAVVILVLLFAVQRRGTASIGKVFGPIMTVWFATIAVLGARQVAMEPAVLRALWPGYAVQFFRDNGTTGYLVLGAVILVVVGGEALYADMGHFGRRPITLSWYGVVLPALLCVYFGQGALLIRDPSAIENPFFRLAPHWMLIPLVVLATMATVIASQALISGAYSLTHQAVQLGYAPRVRIRHTSDRHVGQIYLPVINWVLMAACIALVLGFRRSANLAAAYGVAVSTTMVMTTILFAVVALRRFGWPRPVVIGLCSLFLAVDLAFFGATVFKIPEGGWFPLLVGLVIFVLMTTWRTGRRLVRDRLLRGAHPLAEVAAELGPSTARAPGTAIYLYSEPGGTPPALSAGLTHLHALHERVLVVSVVVTDHPREAVEDRVVRTDLGHDVHQVQLRYGFVEDPDVPTALAPVAAELGVDLDVATYLVGRETVRSLPGDGMARWREHLFVTMARNASDAARHFGLPIERTLEIGVRVGI